jgi:rubrerythrin
MLGGTHLRVTHGRSIEQYRETFRPRQHVPTCSRQLSERYRESAQARTGEKGFAAPPVEPRRPPRPAPAWRSLKQLRPDLAAELHPIRNGDHDAANIAEGSSSRLWWRCSNCGHDWQATVSNRTIRGSGCPVCSAKQRAETQARVALER